LGPTNPALAQAFAERAERLRGDAREGALPVDLLTSSGSGLDPHVSPAAAFIQGERVARARALDVRRVQALVEAHIEARAWGFLGERRVNVLELNLALDALH
jgi:K+-transporting ATPase ATPase C chain